MGTELSIKEKIQQHQASKPVRLAKKSADSKEAIKQLASQYTEAAIKKLNEIVHSKDTPATARVQAIKELNERVAGKASALERPETELSALDKMGSAELMEFITQQFSGLPLSARAIMVESLDKGLAFDAADIAEAIEPAQGLPPLGKPQREKKVPRR